MLKYSSIVILSSLYKYFFANGLSDFSKKYIVITCIGSIINCVTSLEDTTTQYAFPYIIFRNSDSINIFIPNKTIILLIINSIMNFKSLCSFPGFLYKISPYTKPIKAADIVNPGKYAPNGNNKAPIKSPKAHIKHAYLGPKYIPYKHHWNKTKTNY